MTIKLYFLNKFTHGNFVLLLIIRDKLLSRINHKISFNRFITVIRKSKNQKPEKSKN